MFTDHPEYRAFVAQMREHPGDDVVRLACADWLEERGEADRAEFVRVQVERNRIRRYPPDECKVCGNTVNDEGELEHGRGCFAQSEDGGGSEFFDENPEWTALRDRERGLIPPIGWDIPEGLFVICCLDDMGLVPSDSGSAAVVYCRGFVESVTCDAAAWLAHGDAVLAAHPVTRVTLTTLPDWETSYDTADHGYDEVGARLVGDSSVAPWFPMSECWAKGDGRYLRGLLRLRWPGVEFELPPGPQMYARTGGTFRNPVWTPLERPGRVVTVTREDILNDTTGRALRLPPRV